MWGKVLFSKYFDFSLVSEIQDRIHSVSTWLCSCYYDIHPEIDTLNAPAYQTTNTPLTRIVIDNNISPDLYPFSFLLIFLARRPNEHIFAVQTLKFIYDLRGEYSYFDCFKANTFRLAFQSKFQKVRTGKCIKTDYRLRSGLLCIG